MNDSIRRLFELDEAIWTQADFPSKREQEYWVNLALSQLDEVKECSPTQYRGAGEHEEMEWADLFLVALHRLRSGLGDDCWADTIYNRLRNHAHKGIDHIKEKYATP